MPEEQAQPSQQTITVTTRADERPSLGHIERTVRDGPAERPIIREMTRADRVAASASTFSTQRQPPAKPAEAAKPEAKAQEAPTEPKPAEKPTEPAPAEPKPAPSPAVPAEPKPTEQPAEQKEKIAARYAALADRERRANTKIQAENDRLSRERATIAEAKKSIDAFNALKAKATEDPVGFLKENGLTFETLARAEIERLKKPQPTPAEQGAVTEAEIERRVLAKLEEKFAKGQQAATETAQAAERERVREAVGEQLRANDAYPGLKLLNAEAEVFDYAMAVYEKGDPRRGLKPGTKLPLDKAAELMEAVARQEAERRFGPERVRAFIEAGGKTSTAQPETKVESTEPPARADAGKVTGRTTVERGKKDRATDGRLSSKTPNGKGAASAADEEDLSALSFEDERDARKRMAAQSLEASMRK